MRRGARLFQPLLFEFRSSAGRRRAGSFKIPPTYSYRSLNGPGDKTYRIISNLSGPVPERDNARDEA
jgi:hypothetical protein